MEPLEVFAISATASSSSKVSCGVESGRIYYLTPDLRHVLNMLPYAWVLRRPRLPNSPSDPHVL